MSDSINISTSKGDTLKKRKFWVSIIAGIVVILSSIIGFDLDEKSIDILSNIFYELLKQMGL